MSLFENIWFLISFAIIVIILLVDPKSSSIGLNENSLLGLFSSRSSGQDFIYNFSAILIFCFFVLSLILSLDN